MTSNEKRVTYTEQQLNIINGKIPLDTLHGNSLQHLKKKALELGDNGTAEMIGKEIEKRKKAHHQSKLIMIGPKPYTEKQMKILTGEIALEEASGKLLSHLHRKALENKDEDLAAKVKEQLDVLKKEAEKRNAERAIKRTKAVMRNEPIQWRQPKTNEYTDHQKQIVRGEIPFEKVHTKELISICMKARNVGDHELAETVFDLIMDRRAESVSKRKARKKILRCRKFDKTYYDPNSSLSMRQQQLIKGDLASDSFSLEELQIMHKKLTNAGCDFEAAYVMELIKDKQDPTYFFRIKTYEEALCFLENVFQTKIRRLEDWFTDEELENK